jgi:hypothetical protein
MLIEQDIRDQAKVEIQEKIDFNNQIIMAAAKYEREISHKDFLEILNDMRRVKEVLDNELLTLTDQILVTDDPIERQTIQNEFIAKAIRRMVIKEATSYPDRIIHQASLAKEENIELNNKLKENNNATGN